MTRKTVDVICSMESGFPTILEVVDTDDNDYSIERQKYWAQFYKDVHLFSGIDLHKGNKRKDI